MLRASVASPTSDGSLMLRACSEFQVGLEDIVCQLEKDCSLASSVIASLDTNITSWS